MKIRLATLVLSVHCFLPVVLYGAQVHALQRSMSLSSFDSSDEFSDLSSPTSLNSLKTSLDSSEKSAAEKRLALAHDEQRNEEMQEQASMKQDAPETICFGLDVQQRKTVLELFVRERRDIVVDETMNFQVLADKTVGLSLVQLKKLITCAARKAYQGEEETPSLTMHHCEEALQELQAAKIPAFTNLGKKKAVLSFLRWAPAAVLVVGATGASVYGVQKARRIQSETMHSHQAAYVKQQMAMQQQQTILQQQQADLHAKTISAQKQGAAANAAITIIGILFRIIVG